MHIYFWQIALALLALVLAISFVQGIVNKLRGGASILPQDTFRDRRTNRYWRETDGAIQEAIPPRPGIALKVVLAVVAVFAGIVFNVMFWKFVGRMIGGQ